MRTLLLADDSITIQRVIALTFADEDFRVVTVADGQQAIDRIASERPDIVLAGTTMPNLTGYDVSRYVRSQPALKNVPVLLLTGAFESVDEARLVACGASGTLEKPFEPSIVISRVKELLGIKGQAKPTPAAGRLVTSAETSSGQRPRPQAVPSKQGPSLTQKPMPKPSPVSWDELREESGLGADTQSVEGGGAAHEPGHADYLDSLDAAFDTLDARLATTTGSDAQHQPRNPDPPLRRSGPADPRSPGRLPTPKNPSPGASVFEVDDQWFAEGEPTRIHRGAEQRQLAAEMGIHDLEFADAQPGLHPAPADDLDFDFGLETAAPKAPAMDVHDEVMSSFDMPTVPASHIDVRDEVAAFDATPVSLPAPAPALASVPVAVAPAPPEPAVVSAMLQPPSDPVAPLRPKASLPVADAFAALLAHEQGEPNFQLIHDEPSAPVVVQAAAPEITDTMLDQIADRVADRLSGSLFGDHLRAAMASTVRDTVRSVVSETSEKLVRDEIARVKAQAERDTQ